MGVNKIGTVKVVRKREKIEKIVQLPIEALKTKQLVHQLLSSETT